MLSGIHRRARSLAGLFGLFAALSALAGQLAFAATVANPGPAALLAVAGTICHAGEAPAGDHPGDPPAHRDCAICPLCAAVSVHAAAPAVSPVLAGPAPAGFWRPVPAPEAVAVAVRLAFAAQPRGPPALI
ncbi:MAG TPA: hypothetical protein VLJ20_06970 [Acetobacteraceae bacterium]|nr:hypothetical protein [Acetobacteraceae bacterium]